MIVSPRYSAIEAIRDICEPWIVLWGGDEWGEVMSALHFAAHTDYGFSDEDCAIFAQKLVENLIEQKQYEDDYDRTASEMNATREKSREARDYWLKGGNLGDWRDTIEVAKATIDQLPSWLFE